MSLGDLDMANEVAGMIEECIDNIPAIDPVHATGGCYCRECANLSHVHDGMELEISEYICGLSHKQVSPDGFCSYGGREE